LSTKPAFDTTNGAEPNRLKRQLSGRLAAGLVGVAILGSTGCGALGLYSLGHSVLAHNHLLKPILPDDATPPPGDGIEQVECDAGGFRRKKGSSCNQMLPMEITRSLADDACSTACDPSDGD
jgi:hypothetical protein